MNKLNKRIKKIGITEGLSTINYTVKSIEKHLLYTRVFVDYNEELIIRSGIAIVPSLKKKLEEIKKKKAKQNQM